MEKYICDCCGGAIDPRTMTCEYCGTKYKRNDDYWAKPIRLETFQNPVNTYTARVSISEYDMRAFNGDMDSLSRWAVDSIAHELAKSIAPNMSVESERDIRYGGYNIYGTIKVVEPVHGAEAWRQSNWDK